MSSTPQGMPSTPDALSTPFNWPINAKFLQNLAIYTSIDVYIMYKWQVLYKLTSTGQLKGGYYYFGGKILSKKFCNLTSLKILIKKCSSKW